MDYGHLGEATSYSDQYDPALLHPIARSQGREALIAVAMPDHHGFDVWHAYELSWLDQHGKPHVACARFVIDGQSEFLVESKSFKLYLNI